MKKDVLRILTRILTTILKTILKTRILWIQNSLTYTSFFFFNLILNCFSNKHFKIKHHSSFSKFWFERRRNRKRRRRKKREELASSFFDRWHHDFLFSLVHLVIFIKINVALIDEFFIIRARNASREKWINLTNRFRSFAIFAREDSDFFLDTNLDRYCVMSLFFEHFEWLNELVNIAHSLFTYITSNISWQSLQTKIKKDLKKNINLKTLIKTFKNVDWLIDWKWKNDMKWKKNLYSRQNYELRLIKRNKNALFRSNFTNYV
jgi:hypothetical protein